MVARDFESPADVDNVYEAILVAIDADDVPSAVQFAVTVTVTDVQEVVALTISGLYGDDFNPEHVSARQTARVSPEPIGALTWTLAGADARPLRVVGPYGSRKAESGPSRTGLRKPPGTRTGTMSTK